MRMWYNNISIKQDIIAKYMDDFKWYLLEEEEEDEKKWWCDDDDDKIRWGRKGF